jgi:hypothetical protein
MNRLNWSRIPITTLAAFLVINVLFIALFGNPVVHSWFYSSAAGQSEKFVAVWNTLQPTPALSPAWSDAAAMSERKLAVLGLLLVWTLALVIGYTFVADALPGTDWRKGVSYGLLVWAIAFPFFGFFFHFNVLNMPIQFVLGELVLEAIISIATGITIAALYKPALAPARLAKPQTASAGD